MSLYLNCCVSSLIANELVREQFFSLGSTCLLNEPKTKVQAWLIYKQTDMDKLCLFINRQTWTSFLSSRTQVVHDRLGSFTTLLTSS